MKLIRYSNQEKISHLLQWAAGWSDGSKGESAWSYSMKLGGSHSLLNGWINNAKLMSTLTRKEMSLINKAREASKNNRRAKK
jgi:hypothetical protein